MDGGQTRMTSSRGQYGQSYYRDWRVWAFLSAVAAGFATFATYRYFAADDLPAATTPTAAPTSLSPTTSHPTISPAPTTSSPTSSPRPTISPAPTAQRSEVAKFLAETLTTDGSSLMREGTPQHEALVALETNFPDLNDPSSSGENEIRQIYSLYVLYFSTNGTGWLDQTGWMSGSSDYPVCGGGNTSSWYGVSCSSVGDAIGGAAGGTVVTQLNLTGNGLVGTIQSEIRGLIDVGTSYEHSFIVVVFRTVRSSNTHSIYCVFPFSTTNRDAVARQQSARRDHTNCARDNDIAAKPETERQCVQRYVFFGNRCATGTPGVEPVFARGTGRGSAPCEFQLFGDVGDP